MILYYYIFGFCFKLLLIKKAIALLLIRVCRQLGGRMLLKRILAGYKEKNVLHSRATEVRTRCLGLPQALVMSVIFRRSRPLKDHGRGDGSLWI